MHEKKSLKYKFCEISCFVLFSSTSLPRVLPGAQWIDASEICIEWRRETHN